jgi:hypothetical protein
LELSADTVVIHKNGIEFRSPTPFNPWTEMTVALQSPRGGQAALRRRGHRLFRQQARGLPRLDGFHQPLQAGANALEFDGHSDLGVG